MNLPDERIDSDERIVASKKIAVTSMISVADGLFEEKDSRQSRECSG